MIRRHFCIWIEAYIGKLKLHKNTLNDDMACRAKSNIKTSKNELSRSINSKKSFISGYSNSRLQIPDNIPG